MAHLHQLVRAIPLVVALALIPACERNEPTSGDPRVEGITQTPLPDPDLSILGDQRARAGIRPAAPAIAVSTSTAPATAATNATGAATGPEATSSAPATTTGPATTAAPATTTMPADGMMPATMPATPAQPATATAPKPAGG